jgi:aminopeptidase N
LYKSEIMHRRPILIGVAIVMQTAMTWAALGQGAPGKERMPAGIPAEQKWWNLLHYAIDITPDYTRKFVSGTNTIRFCALTNGSVMQIDLRQPLAITSVVWKGRILNYYRRGNAYFIRWPRPLPKNTVTSITIHFEGIPQEAHRPPWESGWIWATDERGRPWMSIACEGSGASVWLPCKDAGYDEPDSGISFKITVPDTLTAVANGRLRGIKENGGRTKTYWWEVRNPINNYDMIPYIGKYVTWHEDYMGVRGKLDCDFWVLDYSLGKAQQHLRQVDTMLRCFEYWCGPYPFYEDGYKLVEAPMPGMEHQSAIAYGNGFENGYSGKNLSGTSWGLKWDFILVHESGHEWFGNSITANSGAAGWIHEGFTKYLETLYTDYVFGTEAGNEYAMGINKRILNDAPIIGGESSDKYNKTSALLHMMRQLIGDSLFRTMLMGLNKTFYHQTVGTEQIRDYMARYVRLDITKLFEQYLGSTKVPVLEYSLAGKVFRYRWTNCVDGFDMPVRVSFDGRNYIFIYPTTGWKEDHLRVGTSEVFLLHSGNEKHPDHAGSAGLYLSTRCLCSREGAGWGELTGRFACDGPAKACQ